MIRFPNRPMADSVVERILHVAKQTDPNSVEAQGARLDQALQQPIGDVAPIDNIEDAIAFKALNI